MLKDHRPYHYIIKKFFVFNDLNDMQAYIKDVYMYM